MDTTNHAAELTSSGATETVAHRRPRRGATPMHQQVAQALRVVVAGLEPRDRLPTEKELMARFGVSRTTLRQAVQALCDEGLVVRKAGMGTFVTSPTLSHQLNNQRPLLADIFDSDHPHTIEMLDFAWSPQTPPIVKTESTGCLTVTRRYLQAATPVALSRLYFPDPVGAKLSPNDFEDLAAIQVLTSAGILPDHVNVVVDCPIIPDDIAPLINLDPGKHCMRVKREHVTDGQVCMVVQMFLPPERVQLSMSFDADYLGAQGALTTT